MHAIGNAVVEALMDFGLDMKLDEVLGGMKQLPFVDIEGNRVEEFNRSRVKMLTDKNSGDPYDIQIHVCERAQEEVQKRLQDKTIKAVAVYREDPLRQPHCVYIEGLAWTGLAPVLGELNYVLINSWGAHNSKFLLGPQEVDATYEVAVTYSRSISQSMTLARAMAMETYNLLPAPSPWPSTTHDRLNFNSSSNSPVGTPSFNSYSSSPTFSDSWMDKGIFI